MCAVCLRAIAQKNKHIAAIACRAYAICAARLLYYLSQHAHKQHKPRSVQQRRRFGRKPIKVDFVYILLFRHRRLGLVDQFAHNTHYPQRLRPRPRFLNSRAARTHECKCKCHHARTEFIFFGERARATWAPTQNHAL